MSSTRQKGLPNADGKTPITARPTLGAMLASAIAALPFRWGATASECNMVYPADHLLPHSDAAAFRAITINAPVPLVFRWLCQLRVAPYSYDLLDNRGRQSPRRLTSGLEALALHQRVMTIFRLAAFAPNEHLTLLLDSRSVALFGQIALTYTVTPITPMTSRLIVKLNICYPAWNRWRITRWLFALGDLIMMRKQLRTFKKLAETMAQRADLAPKGSGQA